MGNERFGCGISAYANRCKCKNKTKMPNMNEHMHLTCTKLFLFLINKQLYIIYLRVYTVISWLFLIKLRISAKLADNIVRKQI